MTMEMHAKAFGQVQGVGMRAGTQSLALEIGIKGSVRNCRDGSVEIVAQGSKEQIEQLVKQLKQRFPIEHLSIHLKPCEQLLEDFIIL